jgi:carboxymethylenebutenolidase
MGEIVEFPSNGHVAQGYLAVPQGGGGPGLVLIQEWWGLVPHITDLAERFAAAGFVTLAPDLFHGEKTTEPDEAGKLMMALNLDQAGRDLAGAVAFLRDHEATSTEKVGVTGFCMGGGLALVLACQQGDAIGASVPWYGLIPWPDAQPDWDALTAPVLMHVAGNDDFFSPEDARKLEADLSERGKSVELHVYEGADHAFFNDDRPEVYDAEAGAIAWSRTVAFLSEHLG